MRQRRRTTDVRLRAVALVVAVGSSGLPLALVTLPCVVPPTRAGSGPTLDGLVVAACAVGALLAWAWLVLAVLVATVAAQRGTAPGAAWVPRLVGLTVAALLGSTVVGSVPAQS